MKVVVLLSVEFLVFSWQYFHMIGTHHTEYKEKLTHLMKNTMGRCILAYAVPAAPEHSDPTTRVCMRWNCVPCPYYDDTESDIAGAIRTVIESSSSPPRSDDDLKSLFDEYDVRGGNEPFSKLVGHVRKKGIVCPLCRWYGLFSYTAACLDDWNGETPVIRDKFEVHHSYGDPVWSSRWCLTQFLYVCPKDTAYPQEEKNVYHVTPEALENMRRCIEDELSASGGPVRTPDKEALKETENFVEWLHDKVCLAGLKCVVYM